MARRCGPFGGREAAWMALFLCLACLDLAAASPSAHPAGRLTALEGEIWHLPPGGSWTSLPLSANLPRDIPAGSLLRTGERGGLELELGQGRGWLRLAPGSELILRPPDAAAPHGSLYLEVGRLHARLGEAAPLLKAPAGAAQAAPGEVEWRSEASSGRAVLTVIAGRGSLAGGGGEIEVAPGQTGVMEFGQAPRLLALSAPAPEPGSPASPAATPSPALAPASPAPAPPAAPEPPAPAGPDPGLPWQVHEGQGGLGLRIKLPGGQMPQLRVAAGPVVEVIANGVNALPAWLGRRPGQGKPLQAQAAQAGEGNVLRLRLYLVPGEYTLLQHLEVSSGQYALDIFPRGETRP